MADGFKVADAFVDVSTELDETGLLRDVETASDKAGNILSEGLADAGKEGGSKFGDSFGETSERKVRDSKGRFLPAFNGIGDEGGKSSGKRFGSGLATGILGGVTGAAGKVGGILSTGLTNIGPAGPVIGGVIVAAVAAAAPLAGAALAGGLMAGVAVGGVGLGIAAAIRQPAVKGALIELKNDATDILDRIGQDWEPTMLSVIANVRGDMRGIGSELKTALAPAKSYVQPLVNGFMNLVRNALPGFNNMLARSGPIIAVLADGLAEIGTALSDAFTDISGEADNAAAGLQTMLYFIADMVSLGGQVIAWLAAGYAKILDWNVGILSILSYLPGVGDQFAQWRDEMKELQATAHGAGPALERTGGAMGSLAGATSRASQSNEAMATRQRILNGTMAQGADEAGTLKTAMDALNGAAQNAEQAQLAYEDAIDQVTASIKDNGNTLSEHTAKGRANRTALLNLAKAGQTHAQAVYDQTAATRGTAAAEQAAAGAYSRSREQLIRSARQMGMNKQEAREYANRIMAIPKNWNTNLNAKDNASGKVRSLKAELASMKTNWTVTIRQQFLTFGKPYSPESVKRGQVGGLATGGPVTGPGPKGVDSELRMLAPGEHVLSDEEVDAAGGHQAIMAWRSALRNGVRLAPASSAPAHASSGAVSAGQAAQVFQFGPGSIVLDLASFKNFQEVMDAVTGLASASRTYRSTTVAKAGIA